MKSEIISSQTWKFSGVLTLRCWISDDGRSHLQQEAPMHLQVEKVLPDTHDPKSPQNVRLLLSWSSAVSVWRTEILTETRRRNLNRTEHLHSKPRPQQVCHHLSLSWAARVSQISRDRAWVAAAASLRRVALASSSLLFSSWMAWSYSALMSSRTRLQEGARPITCQKEALVFCHSFAESSLGNKWILSQFCQIIWLLRFWKRLIADEKYNFIIIYV